MLWMGVSGVILIIAGATLAWRSRARGTAAKAVAFVIGFIGVLLVFAAVWSTDDFRSENTGGEPSTAPTPVATRAP